MSQVFPTNKATRAPEIEKPYSLPEGFEIQ